jgi:hypothetical protein
LVRDEGDIEKTISTPIETINAQDVMKEMKSILIKNKKLNLNFFIHGDSKHL